MRPFEVALLVDDGFVAAHGQADEALRVGVCIAMVDDDLGGENGAQPRGTRQRERMQVRNTEDSMDIRELYKKQVYSRDPV